MLRATKFGDIIIGDHKVLNEEGESVTDQMYAIVVQDLATQWNRRYPCKTQTSQETARTLPKFLDPEEIRR